jgi:DNA-binding transcriptional regulator YhcF (GntR family)
MNADVAHIPKYERIKAEILEWIRNGRLSVGDKLPVRSRLVEEFDSNRVTVDRALNDLVANNILTASRRKGTFVTASLTSLKKVAILTWRASVFQHSNLFGDRYSFFGMYGRLLELLTERRYELIDIDVAFDNPAVLDDFDVVFIQPVSEDELLRLSAMKGIKDKIVLLNRTFEGFKSVSVDHYSATREVTEMYLKNLPDAHFYFIGCENDVVVRERQKGFIDACGEVQKFYRLVNFIRIDEHDCFSENVGKIEIPECEPLVVVSSSIKTTAIMMRHASESGLVYNKNFFYSDFDNENPMAMSGYPITSVLEDYAAVAELAVDGLKDDFSSRELFAPYKIINKPF